MFEDKQKTRPLLSLKSAKSRHFLIQPDILKEYRTDDCINMEGTMWTTPFHGQYDIVKAEKIQEGKTPKIDIHKRSNYTIMHN